VPEGSHQADEAEMETMTWVMTWEQFAEAMQSIDLSEVVHLSQCTYASASRAGAKRQEALNTTPMPNAREELGLRRRFNVAELALIRKGCDAGWDGKWIVYFDPIQSELGMFRAWTGLCIFSLRIREDSEGGEITESWVNRDPEQYDGTDTKYDAEFASWIIDVFLLGRKTDFPSKSQ